MKSYEDVRTGDMKRHYLYECPICGYHTGNQGGEFNYCPLCGAKMDGGIGMKTMYVKIPDKLTENDVAAEYGMDALRFYKNRIAERKQQGKVYHNPLKTIYIWAAQVAACAKKLQRGTEI